MKNLFLLLPLFLVACSQSQNEIVVTAEKYKEALLRTRQVHQVDENIDSNNPIEIVFSSDFTDQLIEVHLEAKNMNSSFYTLVNSDSLVSLNETNKISSISLGELKVSLDGQDITACLLAECNETFCDGGDGSRTSFNGNFKADKVFLNLSKIDLKSTPECSSININSGSHTLKLEEIGSSGSNLKGARMMVQVIKYNRTYSPENILNAFNQ